MSRPKNFFVLLFLIIPIFIFGCGTEDNPITSPHTIAVVHPNGGDGVAYLFASNKDMNRVYRINLESLEVDSIPVGKKPTNVSASPDGRFVAVVNEGALTLSVIETTSMATKTLQTGFRPIDVRFSPDGNWIAVANFEAESVTMINTESWNTTDVWAGGGPASVAFDSTSSFVAVACYWEYSVKVISIEEMEALYTFDWMDTYDYDMDFRPQVVLFGKEGSGVENQIFVGHRHESDIDNEEYAEYNGYLTILKLPEDWRINPLATPSVDVLLTGANPRGLFWNEAGDKLISLNYYFNRDVKDSISLYEVDENGDTDEVRRYVVGGNPVAADTFQDEDRIAVALKNSDDVIIIDLADSSYQKYPVKEKPNALAISPNGKFIIVVHDSALMPVTLIDLEAGVAKVLYDSISMDKWVE